MHSAKRLLTRHLPAMRLFFLLLLHGMERLKCARMKCLVMPKYLSRIPICWQITYRCNLRIAFAISLSNELHEIPATEECSAGKYLEQTWKDFPARMPSRCSAERIRDETTNSEEKNYFAGRTKEIIINFICQMLKLCYFLKVRALYLPYISENEIKNKI